MVQALNASKIECPVELKDLHFCTGLDADGDVDMGKDTEIPFVCIECGHVQSNHGWKRRNGNGVSCYYPYCQKENCLVKLTLGIEPSFWVDCGPPTHAFIPCGHMTSEKTAKYNLWSSSQHFGSVLLTNNCLFLFSWYYDGSYWALISIPHGRDGLVAKCPFCSTLFADGKKETVKLVFTLCRDPPNTVVLNDLQLQCE